MPATSRSKTKTTSNDHENSAVGIGVGATGGVAAGAATGAAIGTAVAGPIGTAVGGSIGAIADGIGGNEIAHDMERRTSVPGSDLRSGMRGRPGSNRPGRPFFRRTGIHDRLSPYK